MFWTNFLGTSNDCARINTQIKRWQALNVSQAGSLDKYCTENYADKEATMHGSVFLALIVVLS